MNRLTKRNANGGISVTDVPAALKKLADYEDRLDAANRVMPLSDVERVLKGGQWREEMINYINDWYDGDFPDWESELNTAIDAAERLVETYFHGY